MALSFDHIGISRISAMKKPGRPTNFRKILTALLRPSAATASPIRTQSSSVVERLSSTMNGGSYDPSFLMPLRRFAASSARTAPEDMPHTDAVPPASLSSASMSSTSRSTAYGAVSLLAPLLGPTRRRSDSENDDPPPPRDPMRQV